MYGIFFSILTISSLGWVTSVPLSCSISPWVFSSLFLSHGFPFPSLSISSCFSVPLSFYDCKQALWNYFAVLFEHFYQFMLSFPHQYHSLLDAKIVAISFPLQFVAGLYQPGSANDLFINTHTVIVTDRQAYYIIIIIFIINSTKNKWITWALTRVYIGSLLQLARRGLNIVLISRTKSKLDKVSDEISKL